MNETTTKILNPGELYEIHMIVTGPLMMLGVYYNMEEQSEFVAWSDSYSANRRGLIYAVAELTKNIIEKNGSWHIGAVYALAETVERWG